MDNDEVYDILIKLYQKKKNSWLITGYKCPYCEKHYHSLRDEIYSHVNKCNGKKKKLDDEDY